MRTWHFSDTGANYNNDTSSDDHHDGDDDQHVDIPAWRVQVLLCAEFGQLVIQMYVGLLHRVCTMCSNYAEQHCLSDGYYDGHGNLCDSNFHAITAADLQVLVCRQCTTLDEKVQLAKV